MRIAALIAAALCCLASAQGADEAFEAQARAAYERILERLGSAHRLDDDAVLAARLRRITERLVPQAVRAYPGTAHWPWEIHVTSDPAVTAFCVAGGKVLVGSTYVERLGLDDDELAMLVAHEMAHALAGHRRERPPAGGMEESVAWENRQAALALAQESEADRIGLELAHGAGYARAGLLGFFDKLAAAEPAGTFSSTHPPAARRAEQARAWAAELPPK